MIFIASDHLGFKYKKEIINQLLTKGYKVQDLGPENDSYVDFPDFAAKVAKQVAADPNARGILLSGTGQGMSIVANKFKNVYAGLVYNETLAEKARLENNTNVLCIPTEFMSLDSSVRAIFVWLSASFSGAEASVRHFKMVKDIEQNGQN
jgi:ribose 5-phosphate isomerase B